jgi:hypothetical protein
LQSFFCIPHLIFSTVFIYLLLIFLLEVLDCLIELLLLVLGFSEANNLILLDFVRNVVLSLKLLVLIDFLKCLELNLFSFLYLDYLVGFIEEYFEGYFAYCYNYYYCFIINIDYIVVDFQY